jgi:hypothetical protein
MMASCVVLLPVRLFGGHEKMLLEWLGTAAAEHGLRPRIFSAYDERLVRACEAAGLQPPATLYPGRANSLRDFFITWRALGRGGGKGPVLFAPGAVQASPLQWLAAFLRRRRVAAYVPLAYSSRQMGFRGGGLRDWLVGHLVRHVHLWITITAQQRELLTQLWRVRSPVFVLPNRPALLEQAAAPVRERVASNCARGPARGWGARALRSRARAAIAASWSGCRTSSVRATCAWNPGARSRRP